MPSKAPKQCRYCKRATRNSNGYCDEHQDKAVAWVRPNSKTTKQRGYAGAWRKKRAAVLSRDNGLCQVCKSKGIYTPATEVDHIKNKADGGDDSIDNLQAICKDCHKIKTHSESVRGRGGVFFHGV